MTTDLLPRTQTARAASVALLLLRARAFFILFALLVLFSLLSPTFLTVNNVSILAKHVAISALLAIGMTFVVLAGGIDLSVGSVAGLGGIVAGLLLTRGVPGGVATAILLSFLVCLAVGLLNGLLVTRAAVAPFIATLGTLYIARGAALLLSNGHTFPNLGARSPSFPLLGQSFLLGVPLPVWLMLLVAVAAGLVAAKTPFGRHLYAVGGNERASRLAGIRIARVRIVTYLFSSLCAGAVGLIIASQLESSHPATGDSFELNAIAAVVLGGTSLMGGRGTVLGSVIGACVIGVLADGLIMLGVSEFWQIVIKGVVIVVAVAVDQLQVRLQARLRRSQ